MAQTRYKCKYCEKHKFVPERPSNPKKKIKTGCETCGSITPHHPVGCA